MYRIANKNNPLGNIYISGIVDFLNKFTLFTEKDAGQISSKFHYNTLFEL